MRKLLLFLAVCLIASMASAVFTAGYDATGKVGYDPLTTEQPDDISTNWVESSHTESVYDCASGSVVDGIATAWLAGGRSMWANDADFGVSTTWTFDIRTKIVNRDQTWYQQWIHVGDGDERIYVCVGDDVSGAGFYAEDGGAPGPYGITHDYSTTNSFNIWRFVRNGEMLYVYLNDIVTPVVSHAAPTANYGASQNQDNVWIGRLESRSVGQSFTDFWLWDDSQAIMAPPVPEPATLTLLALGGGLLLRRKK